MDRRVLFLSFVFLFPISVLAQKTVIISGIVVDSISLVGLPNVHIKVKRTGTGVAAGPSGTFKLTVPLFDTLIFSSVGYQTIEYAAIMNEEDVLIRMRESVVVLPEITTIGSRLGEKKYAERRPVVMPAPNLAAGIISPFTYFSKTEREKRKLVKVQEENVNVRTYVEVVNDPDLKKDMMNEFSLSEAEFYTLLAKFNTENRYVQYLVSDEQIREVLTSFIKKERRKIDID